MYILKAFWKKQLIGHECLIECLFKGAISGLRHFLATESALKMMKNALFHLSSFRSQDILSWLSQNLCCYTLVNKQLQ